jgi:cell division septal protein FtsQ
MSVMLSGGLRLLLMKGAYAKALESMRVLLKNEAIPKVGSELSVSYIDLRYGNRVYFKSR